MKSGLIYDVLSPGIIILLGAFLLAFAHLFDDVNTVLFLIMSVYTGAKLLQYFFNRRVSTRDYENLIVSLSCVLAATSALIFNYEDSTYVLSLTILSWITIVSLIKLIKIDFLIAKKNSLWHFRAIDFTLFVLIGILTVINLFYGVIVQILVLGFYFLMTGVLDLCNSVVCYMVENNQKNKGKNK